VKKLLLAAGWCLLASDLNGQSVLGIISGRVTDPAGVPLAHAVVHYRGIEMAAEGTALCGSDGLYTLPLLPPGTYTIEAKAPGYQDQEIDELELAVSAVLNLPIRLRPLQDLWEQKQHQFFSLPNTNIVKFYGPDVDTSRTVHVKAPDSTQAELEAVMSDVVSRRRIDDLPLAGRDVYSVLLVEPAVSADLTAARGIGLAAAGQRPSSSNFMLDGMENNNYAITGPLFPLPPEAVQEYRVSTNNYSAEFGRTSGYLANVVSKAGTSHWHGLGYLNFDSSRLDANDFQSHSIGVAKPAGRGIEAGAQSGGPLRHEKLFLSLVLDVLHNAGVEQGGPRTMLLPDQALYNQLAAQTVPTAGQQLLLRYRPAVIPTGRGSDPAAPVTLVAPVTLNRQIGMGRLDFSPLHSRHKIMARVATAPSSRPDYNWSPYSAFTSGLDSNMAGIAVSATSSAARFANEARAGWNIARLTLGRPDSPLPVLSSGDGAALPGPVSSIAYGNRNRTWEFAESLLWTAGRHMVKVGGGALLRRIDLEYHLADRGLVEYASTGAFLNDQPTDLFTTLSRQGYAAGQLALPPTDGRYNQRQFDLFVQDSFRITPRLTVNLGIRADDFGPPRFAGNPAPQVVLGQGSDIQSRITSAQLQYATPPGERLYDPPNPNLAGRGGFAFDITGHGDLVLRGGYGIFFDRPFDNLWLDVQSNAWELSHADLTGRFDPRNGVQSLVPALGFGNVDIRSDFSNLTLVQPNLRSAYAQAFFLGMQRRLRRNVYVEASGLGSLGRQIVTDDIVNRHFSDPKQFGAPGNPFAQLNGAVPQLQYRANQGLSNYAGLALRARYSAGRAYFQAAYTWSHAIDNQSDPLNGDFTDLRPGAPSPHVSAFPLQFRSGMDRGNSDFDQRHNVVFSGTWTSGRGFFGTRLSRFARDWRFSALGSLRSGFPFSVTATTLFSPARAIGECIGANVALTPGCAGEVLNGRANLLTTEIGSDQPVAGGRVRLRSAAFAPPAANVSGNTGRNEFIGPGAVNLDISVGRSLAVRRLGEAGRIEVRVDGYNALNHANLGQPNGNLGSASFGAAYYGLEQPRTGLLPILPLRESPRKVQFRLRVVF
jgi:Carboxypeptidase regulatory-like domain